MDAFQALSSKLEATGIYSVKRGTLIYAELMAYAAALQLYYDQLEKLYRERFVSTATEKGLTLYENAMSIYHRGQTLTDRRKSVIGAMSITNQDYTLSGMEKIKAIYGVNGYFTQNGSTYRFHCTDPLTEEEAGRIKKQMQLFCPCGSTLYFGVEPQE